MVSKAKGKFKFPSRGKTGLIYVPADLVKDSQFPLVEGEVILTIEGSKLAIEQLTRRTGKVDCVH
jgi:hypothetical protein